MDALPINIVDLVVLVVLALSALLAFMRGFVAELFAVVAWIGAIFLAFHGYAPATPLVTELTGLDGAVAEILAGAVLFVVSVIVLSILARIVSGALKIASLGSVDRSLGFLFGVIRGAVLVSLAYVLLLTFSPNPRDHPDWLLQARSLPLIVQGSDLLIAALPENLSNRIDTTAVRARQQAEEESLRTLKNLLTSPTTRTGPANPDATTDDQGYTDKERQELNRAIQSTQ